MSGNSPKDVDYDEDSSRADTSKSGTSNRNLSPMEGPLVKKHQDEENAAAEEKPLTFYLPECHCAEERQKMYDEIRMNIETARNESVKDILAPDHPALERFQRALKEHLSKYVEHIHQEIGDFESITRQKNAQKDEIGLEAYELQQFVCKQQRILEDYVDKLKSTSAAREQLEFELKEHKDRHKTELNQLLALEKEEKDLRNEVESINLLIHQTEIWEKEVESDIAISKRMTEKTRKDQRKLMEQKRKQDIILYKLQTEIWRLETELEDIDMKLEVKEREREELAQSVAEGTTTSEALEAEYRCLMHSWNSVVIAIANRDKILNCINQELNKYCEKHKTILGETEKIKKLTREEMHENEKLTGIKQRIMNDIMNNRVLMNEETSKQKKLERILAKFQAVLDQTEIDIHKISTENHSQETYLKVLEREWSRKDRVRCEWEEKIFRVLEEESTNNKSSNHMALRYRQLKAQNRKLEIAIAQSENRNSIVKSQLDSQITINAQVENLFKELNVQKNALEKELREHQEKSKNFEFLIVKKQRYIDKLNNKVMEKVITVGGKEVSPAELKIRTIEKNIDEFKEKIKELQTFWMREQRNVLGLSQTRQEQISTYDLLKKQILILQQKNLKLSGEIESIKAQDRKTARNITNLHNQILMKNDTINKKRGEKCDLDFSNDFQQAQFVANLKDAELHCLRFEAEISELEEDKVILSKQLLDTNREALEWEKKLKIMMETKRQIDDEKGFEGEIGQMKIEIHKMEVRFSQLKKAQEKLIKDLEHCVYRREAIVAGSEAREKRSKGGMEKTRYNFKRRLDDTRNKIRQVENESHSITMKIKKLTVDKKKFGNKIAAMKEEVTDRKKLIEQMIEEYENAKINKTMQFELLVMKQKKLNLFSDLARGKRPYLFYRNECAVMREYNKNEDINNKLLEIVENLQMHFPHHVHSFNMVMNTLNLPKVYGADIDSWACEGYKKGSSD